MESLSISISGKNKKNLGFTLIEIITVISLTVMVFGFSAALGFDAFKRNYLKTEQSTLISVLQKARSQAINNVNNSKHGFYFNGTDYIIFEGDSYGSNPPMDFIVEKNFSIIFGGLTEVVFDQLSGKASPAGEMTLSDGVSVITISISSEGRINW
jgi:Tfp pilus assembly protein FimT